MSFIFGHEESYVKISATSEGRARLTIVSDHPFSQEIYIDKELYPYLELAMPSIKAIVDGDAPEIFPGTNEALDKIGVRKE